MKNNSELIINYNLSKNNDITYNDNGYNFVDYLIETSDKKDFYDFYIKSIDLDRYDRLKSFENYLKSAGEFISRRGNASIIHEKLIPLAEKISTLNGDYKDSIFSLLRTLPFYADFECVEFFIDEDRHIIGANIQKERQSLTMQFASSNIVEYSYAYKSKNPGIFRMTGRAKLTSSLMNSHFIKKILSTIR